MYLGGRSYCFSVKEEQQHQQYDRNTRNKNDNCFFDAAVYAVFKIVPLVGYAHDCSCLSANYHRLVANVVVAFVWEVGCPFKNDLIRALIQRLFQSRVIGKVKLKIASHFIILLVFIEVDQYKSTILRQHIHNEHTVKAAVAYVIVKYILCSAEVLLYIDVS